MWETIVDMSVLLSRAIRRVKLDGVEKRITLSPALVEGDIDLTYEFQYLLYLIGCSAQGKKPNELQDAIDWQKLSCLSYEQTVDALLAYALKVNPDIPCPRTLHEQMASSMRIVALRNSMRRERIMKLLHDFETEGMHAVLLKGYAVAGEYCAPECRTSVDTDIWVKPEDEEKACEFLKSRGFAVEPRWKNGHHAVCQHPEMGCVELHVILYDEIVEEIWFNSTDGHEFVTEPHKKIERDDDSYYTLAFTDHLIFLTLHMIKHFILSGMSLRMMLDVALFFKNHHHEVDIQRFWKTMRSLKYEVCVQTVLNAMVLYAGFQAEDFPELVKGEDDRITEMLEDLEVGGSMGVKDKANREEGWNAYNRAMLMKNRSQLAYLLYMLKWQSSLYLKSVFPTRAVLAKRYPYVLDKPWLIPYAWTHRLITRGFKRLRKGNIISHTVTNEDDLSQSGKERLAMFRRFGML